MRIIISGSGRRKVICLTTYCKICAAATTWFRRSPIECRYGYRKSGPEELQPVGETEFLEAMARQVAADPTIKTRIAAAIVGHANLTLGDAVAAGA